MSIGVPVYNGEAFLDETLRSLRGQTFCDFEVVISDNASEDRTEEICRDHAASDHRFRYVRNPENIGLARNFGRLVELASGEYFKLANADDLSAPELVRKCVAVLDREPCVVLCYGKTMLIDGAGASLGDYEDRLDLREPRAGKRFRLALRRTGLVNVLQGVMRTDALRRTGLLGSYMGSDVVLVAELALHGQFHELAERLFQRRIHGQAFSSMNRSEGQQATLDPRIKKLSRMHGWRLHREYLRAAWRAPVGLGEKIRCTEHVIGHATAVRDKLMAEVRGRIAAAWHR